MRSLWLLSSMLLALTTSLPVQAAPIHDLTSQVAHSAIAPIEIRELVIKAQVKEVAAPLAEFSEQEAGFGNDLDAFVVFIIGTLSATDRCEADENQLDGACVAETILGRMSTSDMVQKVIVRGWDFKGKKSTAHLKELAAKPTMAGAREVLIAILGALILEAQDNNVSQGDIALLEKAFGAVKGWPVKWSGPELDATKNE